MSSIHHHFRNFSKVFIKTAYQLKYPRCISHRFFSIRDDDGSTWAEREKALENAYFIRKNNEDIENLRKELERRRRKYAHRKHLEEEANKIRLECAKEADKRAEGITEEICIAQREMDKHINQEEMIKEEEEAQYKEKIKLLAKEETEE